METLETRLADLTAELELAGDWTDRYRLLVEWGEEMDTLAEADRVDGLLVAGCSSPLWFRVTRVGGRLEVLGASTGILPRALVALVRRLFDGLEAPALADAPGPQALVDRLGMRRHLSPTRVAVLESLFGRALGGAAL